MSNERIRAAWVRGDELFRQVLTAAVSTDEQTYSQVCNDVAMEICRDDRDPTTLGGFIFSAGMIGQVLVGIAAIEMELDEREMLEATIRIWRRQALGEPS